MNIVDCFGELIAYSVTLMKDVAKSQPSYEEVYDNVNELINYSEKLAAADGISTDSFERSLFAICAWLDEQILFSDWHQKDIWQQNPLQKQYFKTTQAGDQFFEVLDRFDPILDREIIEIYKLCMRLGFQGKNFHQQTSVQLIENPNISNTHFIEYSDYSESEIFPFAYGGEFDQRTKKTSQISINFVVLIIAIISICGIGFIGFIYDMLLKQQIAGYFK